MNLEAEPRTPGSLANLAAMPVPDLHALLARLGGSAPADLERGALVRLLAERQLAAGVPLLADGVLEVLPDGFGFVRSARADARPQPHDVFVSPAQIQHLHLRSGHRLVGPIRAPRDGERFLGLAHVDLVNGGGEHDLAARAPFAQRAAVLPTRRLRLLPGEHADLLAIEVLAPWSHGHRVLVSLPPEADGAAWCRRIAAAACARQPALRLVLALLDQRPEAAALAHRQFDDVDGATVLASTFDEPAARHVAVAELALSVARREVEAGRDVLLCCDSLTAYARAANVHQAPSGRLLCAGLDATAVLPGKQLFAAARACEGGGTLSVVATAVGGGTAADRAIHEQFHRRANSEVAFADGGAPGDVQLDVAGTWTRSEDLPFDRQGQLAWRRLRTELLALPAEQRLGELTRRLAARGGGDALLGGADQDGR